MSRRVDGRVVVVTGGGSGIGAAIARGLAAEGAALAVADRDEAAARKGAEEINGEGGSALAFRADAPMPSTTTTPRAAVPA
jgi:meso-butanediol dehydrogenase / (S,S)-butanediol dehydrogenase / diacetyl reductase